jgi:NAD-dependent dihydropyrimidine dehydrogenase PreA subunit
MAYIITEPCIGTKDNSCADVCPVDCIHPAPGEDLHEEATMLYIDPAECIDCDACVEACPVDATMAEDDVPAQWEVFKEINRVYFEEGHEAGEKMVADYLAAKA